MKGILYCIIAGLVILASCQQDKNGSTQESTVITTEKEPVKVDLSKKRDEVYSAPDRSEGLKRRGSERKNSSAQDQVNTVDDKSSDLPNDTEPQEAEIRTSDELVQMLKSPDYDRNLRKLSSDGHNRFSAEYTRLFVCPRHCKGSGGSEAGNCPVCGLEYQVFKVHIVDGHTH